MNIGIDISQIVYGSGVSVYTKNLVRELLHIDKKNSYVLYAGVLRRKQDIYDFTNTLSGNFKLVVKPIPPTLSDLLWNRIRVLNIESVIGDIDIFHSSDWSEPKTNAHKVTTVHDLAPILFKAETPESVRVVHTRKLQLVKDEVASVIVPSNQTKSDLIKEGFDGRNIFVIPEAPDDLHIHPKKIIDVNSHFNFSGDYILAVGSAPRKNIERVIKAHSLLDVGKSGITLVIVGSGISRENVIFTERVTSDELTALYKGARALVYASLYEGFGIPILEAYANKCPVVTSNVGSMKEVSGSASVLVDPTDVMSIKEGIETALRNRETLIAKGATRVKGYSWRETAHETLKVYERTMLLRKKTA